MAVDDPPLGVDLYLSGLEGGQSSDVQQDCRDLALCPHNKIVNRSNYKGSMS